MQSKSETLTVKNHVVYAGLVARDWHADLDQLALKAWTAFEPEKAPSAKTLRAPQHSVVLTMHDHMRPTICATKASVVKMHEQTPFGKI